MAEPHGPPRTADVADALREGITRGYLGIRDAIEWAQSEVLGDAAIADPLITHLARSGHRPTSNILLILGQIAWGADTTRASRVAARHLRDALVAGRINARTTANAVRQLARDGYAPDAEFERDAARFWEEASGNERPDVATGLAPRLLSFLDRYLAPAIPSGQSDLSANDHLTIAADGFAGDVVELSAQLAWRWWSGRARLGVARDRLASFATEMRDFAAHKVTVVRFAEQDDATGAAFSFEASEYARARRASMSVRLRDQMSGGDAPVPGCEIAIVAPSEHELIGDFAADLAEIAATGSGVARLRLLARWATDR